MKQTLLALIVLLAVRPSVAAAESLEEKTYWKGQTAYVERALADGEKRCGVKFTFAWVDKPTMRERAEKAGHTPNGICTNMIELVVSLCRDSEDGKAAVKEKIAGFKCGYANPRTVKLEKGVVTYMGNNEEANFLDWAKPIITKRL